jgi:hypothetical protein
MGKNKVFLKINQKTFSMGNSLSLAPNKINESIYVCAHAHAHTHKNVMPLYQSSIYVPRHDVLPRLVYMFSSMCLLG